MHANKQKQKSPKQKQSKKENSFNRRKYLQFLIEKGLVF